MLLKRVPYAALLDAFDGKKRPLEGCRRCLLPELRPLDTASVVVVGMRDRRLGVSKVFDELV